MSNSPVSNQGVLVLQTESAIVMNNDVLVSPFWIENLIGAAEKIVEKIIFPILIEDKLNYDFYTFGQEASQKMPNTHRIGARNVVFSTVHRSIWMNIGFFQPVPTLLGYEDTLFLPKRRWLTSK
jgi:GT2 family glycosyltransferase